MKFLLVSASILCRSLAELFAKAAALQSTVIGSGLLNSWLLLVALFMVLQTAAWTFVLKQLPLVFAYPFMCLALPLTFFGSALFFNEAITTQHLFGVLIIVCGILLATWPVKVPR